MNKTIIYYAVLFTLATSWIVLSVLGNIEANRELKQLVEQVENYTEEIVVLNNTTTIEEQILQLALDDFSLREYKFGVYDCTQYSERLVKDLKEQLNITSQCVFGVQKYYKKTGQYPLHTWIEANISGKIVPIDAMPTERDGGISIIGVLTDEDYKENFRVITRGQCL